MDDDNNSRRATGIGGGGGGGGGVEVTGQIPGSSGLANSYPQPHPQVARGQPQPQQQQPFAVPPGNTDCHHHGDGGRLEGVNNDEKGNDAHHFSLERE